MAAFEDAVLQVIHSMGLRPLKTKQLESLHAFVSGHDTFVALPTALILRKSSVKH